MLLFKEPPDVRLLLTSHEPEMGSRVERRRVKKSYRLKRQEEARQILFPPPLSPFSFPPTSGCQTLIFPSVEQGRNSLPSRRNQAAVRLFVLRVEFTFQIQGPGWKRQIQRDWVSWPSRSNFFRPFCKGRFYTPLTFPTSDSRCPRCWHATASHTQTHRQTLARVARQFLHCLIGRSWRENRCSGSHRNGDPRASP